MSAAEGNQTKIRVFLVDDHPIVREGVRSYLANHGIAVVGGASDAKEALRKIKALMPDVTVLDVNLPSIDGGELARRLHALVPKVKLIAFSIHSSEEYVVKMTRCGVQGYVTKDQPAGDLLDAIKHVFRGGLRFPAGISAALKASESGFYSEQAADAPLTGRELQVLTLLAGGSSNKGVAAKLGISARTAEAHRENLSRKLGIHALSGLTKYAIAHGLTSL